MTPTDTPQMPATPQKSYKALAEAAKVVKCTVEAAIDEITSELREALKS